MDGEQRTQQHVHHLRICESGSDAHFAGNGGVWEADSTEDGATLSSDGCEAGYENLAVRLSLLGCYVGNEQHVNCFWMFA